MLPLEWWQLDADAPWHESGHAVAIQVVGGPGRLVQVVGHRWFAGDGQSGFVRYDSSGLTDEQRALILLAGRAVTHDLDILVDADAPDEREAVQLVGRKEADRLRGRAWLLVGRRDVKAAIVVLAAVLHDRPVLDGPEAEAIIRAALDLPAAAGV